MNCSEESLLCVCVCGEGGQCVGGSALGRGASVNQTTNFQTLLCLRMTRMLAEITDTQNHPRASVFLMSVLADPDAPCVSRTSDPHNC